MNIVEYGRMALINYKDRTMIFDFMRTYHAEKNVLRNLIENTRMHSIPRRRRQYKASTSLQRKIRRLVPRGKAYSRLKVIAVAEVLKDVWEDRWH